MICFSISHLWWSFDRRRAASPKLPARRPTLSRQALDGPRGGPFWWRNWRGRHRGLRRGRRLHRSGDLKIQGTWENGVVYGERILEKINCLKVGLHWTIRATVTILMEEPIGDVWSSDIISCRRRFNHQIRIAFIWYQAAFAQFCALYFLHTNGLRRSIQKHQWTQ